MGSDFQSSEARLIARDEFQIPSASSDLSEIVSGARKKSSSEKETSDLDERSGGRLESFIHASPASSLSKTDLPLHDARRALSDQLYGTPKEHWALRREVQSRFFAPSPRSAPSARLCPFPS